jgi:hypothetical protein
MRILQNIIPNNQHGNSRFFKFYHRNTQKTAFFLFLCEVLTTIYIRSKKMHNKNIIDVTQRPGFIYVMSIPSFQNVLKIGKTTRLPGYRAAQLSSSSGLPEPFKVEYSRFVERDLDAIETRIHQELAAHRICDDRKFFRLSADEAIDKIDEIIDDHMAYKFGKIIYQHRQHAKWGVFLEHIGVPFQYLPEPVHIAWKQRVKNQPKSPFKNQPTPTIDTPVRVRLKPDSKERVFRPEQKPAYIFSLCS